MGEALHIQFRSNRPQLERAMLQDAERALKEANRLLRDHAFNKLTGPRSGRWYRIPGTNRLYQASAPGEPPAERLGDLRRSLRTVEGVEGEALVGYMGTDKDYGRDLETGTMRVLPRPWMIPTYQECRDRVIAIFEGMWR